MTEIEAYIRAAAIARGIDPDVAVKVAMHEGGVKNPVRQSDVVKDGRRETSYGPFQLLIGGGLGDVALSRGIDPRKPEFWKQGVDLALDTASKEGWGQWYGAKAAGLSKMAGIGGAASPKGISLASTGSAPVAAPGSALPPSGPGVATSPLEKIFAALGANTGGQQQQEEEAVELARPAPSAIGAEVGGGQIAAQAAMLMASLLEGRRNRRGMNLYG